MKSKRRLVALVVFAFLCCALSAYAADGTATINASTFVRAIPETLHGTNTHCWDGLQNGGNDNFNNLMAASGRRYVRWPGGSWADAWLWSDMEGVNDANTWIVSYDESMYWINKTGSILQPIVNFKGYYNDVNNPVHDVNHLPEAITAAANWVADQSSRIPTARYWEIGNEVFGPWEAGYDANMCGTYYGNRYADFYVAMKAVNNQVKIGAVAQEYNTADWWNPGLWTRDSLYAAYAKGVVPDFLIIHQYPGSDQGTSYNTTMLAARIDDIGAATTNFTTSMNNIIANCIGPQYVGKIKYWMTEWDAGGTGSYERWKAYINLMFQSQYIMEMAKYGWEGSNPWSQNEFHNNEANYPNFYVYPKWYVSPLLKNYFGRDMVYGTDNHSKVRTYAARDDANNLTIFMVNNYPSTDLVITVNISGFTTDTTGQSWLVQPAGAMIPGGASIQDYNDIMINGVVHPNPLTIANLPGVPMAVSNSFEVNLPRSAMLFIKIPPASPTDQLPYGGTPWLIPGTIEAEDYDTGGKFIAYYDTNTGNSGGKYRSDSVDIETCSEGGYDVNGIYTGEWLEYSVDVNASGIYKIEARVASDSNGAFRIEFDGQDVTGPVTFPATGGVQIFTNVDVNKVFLRKGLHTMRLLMDANNFNINYIDFSKVGGGSGKALREWWTGIAGSAVSNLTSNGNYPNNPTGRERARSFEGPSYWINTSGTQLDNYGTRIRGYLHPIADGNYTFWIASDDASELWMATDANNPGNKTRIAKVSSNVNAYKWDKNAEQKSSPIWLTAGQEYYIEALHKEGNGNDHIAVAWEGPGIIRQALTGPYLTPTPYHDRINFTDFADFSDQWLLSGCVPGNIWCSEADYDRDGTITFDDFMQFVDNFWLTAAE